MPMLFQFVGYVYNSGTDNGKLQWVRCKVKYNL